MSKHYDPNIRDDWDDQKLAMCEPENFRVSIRYTGKDLSLKDQERLARKLKMVEKTAAKLSGGMLKGTLKYCRDDWSVEDWIRYLRDDLGDCDNYLPLLEDAYYRETGKVVD